MLVLLALLVVHVCSCLRCFYWVLNGVGSEDTGSMLLLAELLRELAIGMCWCTSVQRDMGTRAFSQMCCCGVLLLCEIGSHPAGTCRVVEQTVCALTGDM